MSRTVLVVDDAAFIRQLIRGILVRDGYDVHEAVSGRDAIEKFRELRPDLVTMDVNMPGMSGIEALREIRGESPAARIIMVSALRDPLSIQAAREAGALDYVLKPFQPTSVLEAVRRNLARNAS